MIMIIIIIALDAWWHIWEYKERKRLDDCWNDLFNSKLDADRRYIDLFKKLIEGDDARN